MTPVNLPLSDSRSQAHPSFLRIVSLGGFGRVTSNMFVYEYGPDIILVDCGMGFPTEDMLGVDILIPDVNYLKNKIDRVRGMIITHGHEDHTGALPYVLPKLGGVTVYASRLTANLIMEKLAEYENMPSQINILQTNQPLKLGSFEVESVHVTHSIPDAINLIIKTPVGTIYHGSDFKFDFTPVDGRHPDIGRIAAAGNHGIKLLLSDCLGSERKGLTPTEKTLQAMFDHELATCEGKFIVTTMSSNISRWQQAATAAIKHGRRIAISGKSIEKNIAVATKLGYLNLPRGSFIDLKSARKLPSKNLCVLIAGSQGQSGSALERLAVNDHHDLRIEKGDKVVFSSDAIPGSETAVQTLIDTLAKQGACVVYSGLTDNLHVSGHGSQQDLLLMMALTRPQYVLPIGGTYRHMAQYASLAKSFGFSDKQILLPEYNQPVEISDHRVSLGKPLEIKDIMVDGLGVGDVGSVVLRDRQHLAEEGILVAVLEVDQNNLSQIADIQLLSRGFVFDKQNASLLSDASSSLRSAIAGRSGKIESVHHLKQFASDHLETFFFHATRRRPMILPIVVQV